MKISINIRKLLAIALIATLAVTGGAWFENYVPGNFKTVTSHPSGVGAGATGKVVLEELAANGTDSVSIRAADSISTSSTIVPPTSAAPSVGDAVKVQAVSGGVITLEYGAVGGATYATSGDYLLIPDLGGDQNGTTSLSGSSANDVIALKVFVDKKLTINKLTFNVSTGAGGSSGGVGIYANDGNTLLVDSGPVSTASGGEKTVTLGVAYTIDVGFYWLAYTATSTSVNFTGLTTGSNFGAILGAASPLIFGKAANAGSGGQLPATLGSISAASSTGAVPYLLLRKT